VRSIPRGSPTHPLYHLCLRGKERNNDNVQRKKNNSKKKANDDTTHAPLSTKSVWITITIYIWAYLSFFFSMLSLVSRSSSWLCCELERSVEPTTRNRKKVKMKLYFLQACWQFSSFRLDILGMNSILFATIENTDSEYEIKKKKMQTKTLARWCSIARSMATSLHAICTRKKNIFGEYTRDDFGSMGQPRQKMESRFFSSSSHH